ncbi:MAG: SxtJ family membrane protein [Cocleimonas sp.]
MSEFKNHTVVEVGSEKNFGVVFSILFICLASYFLYKGSETGWYFLIMSSALFIVSFTVPKLFYFPNLLWFKFGIALGALIAPVVMAFIYFAVITPIGLVLRLKGSDVLQQRLDPKLESYWIKRDEALGSMKKQF